MTEASASNRADWLPAGAIDSHLHVVDPTRFPYADGPGYKPLAHEIGTTEQLTETLDAHGIAGALLVQPSCYSSDNGAMLAAMRAAPGRYRAIAMVEPDVSEAELDELTEAGTVGIRLNAVNMGADAVRDATPLLARLAKRDWIIQLQCPAAQLGDLSAPILKTGARLILDHLAYPDAVHDAQQSGFRHAVQLAATGRVFVKLSGAFRLSRQPFPHADMNDFVSVLLNAFGPERCVWGSDWPFVAVAQRPSYRSTLDLLARWLPDENARRTVLVETPRALFSF